MNNARNVLLLSVFRSSCHSHRKDIEITEMIWNGFLFSGLKRPHVFLLLAVFLTLCLLQPGSVLGHGRLIEPPSRASMWRYGYHTPPNYSDNQLFCGGFAVQWSINKGKCGVCGDPWQGPREHEAGGKYARGIIVRRYDIGAVITVIVQITASHLGYFEFRLCPVNNPNKPATWECLNKHLLALADGSGTKYYVTRHGPYNYQVRLKLPSGLNCTQCVLQWKYNAGNSWGIDASGKGCTGCGAQEQFYACADIAIGDKVQLSPISENLSTNVSRHPGGVAMTTTGTPLATATATATTITASPTTTEQWHYNWIDIARLDDNKMDVNSEEWFSGNLNLTILSQDKKMSPPADPNEDIQLRRDGDQFVVTENKWEIPEKNLLSEKIYFYDSDQTEAVFGSEMTEISDLGLQGSNRKTDSYDIINDAPYRYTYFDDSDESSGVDDYEYISILQSLIDTLQSKLREAQRTRTAVLDRNEQTPSAQVNVSEQTRNGSNTTNEGNVTHDADGYKEGKHINTAMTAGNATHLVHYDDYTSVRTGRSYREIQTSERSSVSHGRADKGKRVDTPKTRKYNLMEMLRLSSGSSTVKPNRN